MLEATRLIRDEIVLRWKSFLLYGLVFALMFQLFMLIALIVRFHSLPNYVHFYDWFGNVLHIIQSTPSWSDAAGILTEEWLIEIGQMNYDYGNGLSIWSLNVIPSRLLVLTLMGSMVALCLQLIKRPHCAVSTRRSALAAIGGGSVMVAMTNATMSWVVCCAAPSWVVGLAMLGLGVSTSLALESMGPVLSYGGFSLLLITCFILSWRNTKHQVTMPGGLDHA